MLLGSSSGMTASSLQALVEALYPMYLRPFTEGALAGVDHRQLHSRFQPILRAAQAAFESGPSWRGALADLASTADLSAFLRYHPSVYGTEAE